MGLKEKAQLPEVWGWIREAAASNLDAQTCLLLVGHDVDGIAASAMLTVRPTPPSTAVDSSLEFPLTTQVRVCMCDRRSCSKTSRCRTTPPL